MSRPAAEVSPTPVAAFSVAAFSVDDRRFMEEALRLADEASAAGEVPVGCVAVFAGEIVGRGRNAREAEADPLAHAELRALAEAARRLGRWRLSEVTVYVTLEPCPMCAGAMVNARVSRVVFGCTDPKAGAAGTLMNLLQDPRLNHRVPVEGGLFAEEAAARLRAFFAARRAR